MSPEDRPLALVVRRSSVSFVRALLWQSRSRSQTRIRWEGIRSYVDYSPRAQGLFIEYLLYSGHWLVIGYFWEWSLHASPQQRKADPFKEKQLEGLRSIAFLG